MEPDEAWAIFIFWKVDAAKVCRARTFSVCEVRLDLDTCKLDWDEIYDVIRTHRLAEQLMKRPVQLLALPRAVLSRTCTSSAVLGAEVRTHCTQIRHSCAPKVRTVNVVEMFGRRSMRGRGRSTVVEAIERVEVRAICLWSQRARETNRRS